MSNKIKINVVFAWQIQSHLTVNSGTDLNHSEYAEYA